MRLGMISQPTRRLYYRELKEVLGCCMATRRTAPFRRFIRKWIKKGAPIDPAAMFAPVPSLAIIVHQLIVALNIERWKGDALIWLRLPDVRLRGKKITDAEAKRMRPYDDTYIPWNIALYGPKDSPYEVFNKVGFTVEAS